MIKLESFDDLWGLGYPALVEERLRELLSQAEFLPDKSIYLQILTQVALAQALQGKFDEAHATLDTVQELLTPEYDLARVRYLLERGRVFQQAERIPAAHDLFVQSFELSKQNKFDFHTINAAHMIAIVAPKVDEKMRWNQLAIDLAENTHDERARLWLGSLYNNLGQNLLEVQHYEKALCAFQKALEYREKEGYAPNIRVAKWAVAHTLRLLDRFEEALSILHALVKEYDAISHAGSFDMPAEMFTLTRGFVYEDLAEIYYARAKMFATLAYADLSSNEMFKKSEPKRVERVLHIKQ